jgi:predicted RecA/RadA family phage recombinase
MRNFVHRGDTLTVTAPYAVSAGGGMLVGNIFGIAANDQKVGDSTELAVVGVFDLAKDTSTFADGDKVYWDDTNKVATSTSVGTREIGLADLANANGVNAAGGASGDATVRVRLNAISLGVATFTGPSARQVAVVPLSSADILALNSSPKALVPAPGAGKVAVLEQLIFQFKFGTVAYAAGGALKAVYHGATTALHAGTIPAAAITAANAAANSTTQVGPQTGANGLALSKETGIDLMATGADFTTGDGTAEVWVFYSVLTLA